MQNETHTPKPAPAANQKTEVALDDAACSPSFVVKIKYFRALYHDKKDLWYYETPTGRSRWHNKQGDCNAHAKLAEDECQRRGWVLGSKSDEAIRVLRVLKSDIDHLGHWIPEPCRKMVEKFLENAKHTHR